ncbi:MAG: hypothetical protein AB7D36_05560 [Oscillospiraceae bacterium]
MDENANVKAWYISKFRDDELGRDIKASITFKDVFEALDNYNNIYHIIGVGDSVIRERIFEQLADVMRVDYDYIYSQWLMCAD